MSGLVAIIFQWLKLNPLHGFSKIVLKILPLNTKNDCCFFSHRKTYAAACFGQTNVTTFFLILGSCLGFRVVTQLHRVQLPVSRRSHLLPAARAGNEREEMGSTVGFKEHCARGHGGS